MANNTKEVKKEVSTKKVKLIYLPKEKKDGSKWFKPMTIIKGKDGKDNWVLIKFNLENVNVNKFKNKSQILSVLASDIEPHLFGFKKWQDKEGKWHEPYIYINDVVSYKEAPNNFKSEEPNVDDMCFVCDEEETSATEFDGELPFNE